MDEVIYSEFHALISARREERKQREKEELESKRVHFMQTLKRRRFSTLQRAHTTTAPGNKNHTTKNANSSSSRTRRRGRRGRVTSSQNESRSNDDNRNKTTTERSVGSKAGANVLIKTTNELTLDDIVNGI